MTTHKHDPRDDKIRRQNRRNYLATEETWASLRKTRRDIAALTQRVRALETKIGKETRR